jgi:hypothetical protein
MITDEFLEEQFKTLLYDFAEIDWDILTEEANEKYFGKGKEEKFNEKQLNCLRGFVKNFMDDLTEKPK